MQEPSDLRAASLSGVRWVSLARLIAEMLTVGSSVVLARLIPPAEFGRAAIAYGFVAIALAVAWAGFGSALVQMRSIDREDVEVATFLSVGTGGALALVIPFLLAPYVIAPLFGERVAYLLVLASPTFLASGLGAVPTAILQRQLKFRRLSEIEIVALVAGIAAAIVLAAVGELDGEAIVLGGVTTAWVGTVQTLLVVRPAIPRWRRHRAGGIASFGAFAALTAVIGTLFNNVDYAILGARLSPQDVGFYWRAYQVGVEYQSKISGIVLRLAFPIFSRTADLGEMRRLRGKMLRAQTIAIYPVLTTLIALAPEVVPLAYGPAWEPAVFPTQVLAAAGMAAAAVAGSAQMAFAAGKPRAVLWFFIALLAGYVVVVTWSSAFGLRTVVIAVAAYQVVFAVLQFYSLDHRQMGIPLRDSWNGIFPALAASLISLSATYPTVRLISAAGALDVVVILVGGIVAVSMYALALRVLFPVSWHQTAALARALVVRGGGTRPADIDKIDV
ncbi:MAG: oligosaccharide flippase family protein [Gaiellaceae bacterium]